ncbi:hypothetical protein dqs_2415 [Azoarcus olearius]|uniref:DsbA family oxidoreductase n=1 Tax=Azoarcus sp. (strain BH72) TaxID=418699 RepID=UPI00080631E5|nr:DsbA family oxidoreductase [Azoarcus olearius]ANQ85446.1 hypothetical protein dqs_2415 [Azoarcus olearius]
MLLNIDLVSDFVCPWCFIGKTRLERALADLRAARPEVETHINWLPFFLNPDTPAEGEPYRAFLEAKFGGPAAVDAVWAKVAEAGAPDVSFAFDRIRTRPNTLPAHRLIYRAQASGAAADKVARLANDLFVAHFQQGRDIGDIDTLVELASPDGGKADAFRNYLKSDADADTVRRMAGQVQQQGISAVPFFIFNRKIAVSGAQSAGALGAAMLQALE